MADGYYSLIECFELLANATPEELFGREIIAKHTPSGRNSVGDLAPTRRPANSAGIETASRGVPVAASGASSPMGGGGSATDSQYATQIAADSVGTRFIYRLVERRDAQFGERHSLCFSLQPQPRFGGACLCRICQTLKPSGSTATHF
jgi:hypothetical protein